MAPQVSYNGSVSISTKTKTLDVLDGNQYREFIKSYYGEESDAAALLGTAKHRLAGQYLPHCRQPRA